VKPAEFSFKYALAVEEIHHGLYSRALEAVEAGNDMPATSVHVCPVCGYTVEGGVPDRCPVCNVPGKRFVEVA
jgi:rubrerythrin